MEQVATPDRKTIDEICDFLSVTPERCVKTLFVDADDGGLVALALRGDHELNAIKAERLAGVASPLNLADPDRVADATGSPTGFVGPVGLDVPMYVDHSAAALADFTCGANAVGRAPGRCELGPRPAGTDGRRSA